MSLGEQIWSTGGSAGTARGPAVNICAQIWPFPTLGPVSFIVYSTASPSRSVVMITYAPSTVPAGACPS